MADDMSDLPDLALDHYKKSTQSQLCIPQDPLADLEWFPSFSDDFISLPDLFLTPEKETLHCNRSPAGFQMTEEKTTLEKPEGSKTRVGFPNEKQSKGVVMMKKKRRCSHCQTDKTPQWRMGPMGQKTLCNACGVRYKSGRLVPEYRPAASPTFNGLCHSNFHSKILRRKGINY